MYLKPVKKILQAKQNLGDFEMQKLFSQLRNDII